MDRRDFIKASVTMAAGSMAAVSTRAVSPMLARRPSSVEQMPNILVITTDQQYAGALSCTGNPYVKTPAMDRLAAEGTRFERAYCANPICVPSRTSYMTGTFPHQNGIDYNAHTDQMLLDPQAHPCLPGFFRQAGYVTGHFGKWHIPAPLDNPDISGFDTVAAMRNNAVDFDIVAPCMEFINKPRNQPFLAFASFVNPHDICEYARILSDVPDRLKNGEIGTPPDTQKLPPVPANWMPPADEPEAIRIQYNHPDTLRVYPSRTWGGTDDTRWRHYLWAYYRMTELVDRYIGELLDGLDQSGMADETLILFSSDHGDGMACHRWNQKTMFYDECSRVPFIIKWPGKVRPGGVDTSTLIQLGTDLFPTLFAAAGITAPGHLHGLSALPAARIHNSSQQHPAHPYIVVQNNLQTRYGERADSSGRMLRSKRYKYIRYNNGNHPEQLFDMEIDPLETRSLVYSQNHQTILEQHRQWLDQWMAQHDDPFAIPV